MDVVASIVVVIVLLVVLVKGASLLGIAFGRSGPAGLLGGMFSAPSLDWPHGVQEEDRDRVWSWDLPRTEQPTTEPPAAEVVEVTAERAPVQRVRGRRLRDGAVAPSGRAAAAVAQSTGPSGRGS
jgi:hypothetical protein